MENSTSSTRSAEGIKIVEEPIDNIPLLIKECDSKENALYIPLLTTNGNALFADITELAEGIVGIARRTNSGRKTKVGFADASKEQLRFPSIFCIMFFILSVTYFII